MTTTNLPQLTLLGLLASTLACSGSVGTPDQTVAYSTPTLLSCAATRLGVGDFNGDGLKDLLSACPSDSSPDQASQVAVYLNQGGGSFGDPVEPGIDEPDPWVFDVNGDGRDDIVTSSQVSLGQADGTFERLS